MKQQLAAAIACMGLVLTSSIPVRAGEAQCLDALLRSFDATVDVSSCGLLSLEDGRVAGVLTEAGLFVQAADGDSIRYFWLQPDSRQVTVKRQSRKPWRGAITGIQSFPDAKSFYFPFFLDARNRRIAPDPRVLQRHCPKTSAFSVAGKHSCE